MQTVQQIAQQIVAREGGYVNDPDDPGGATNYGVTIGTLRDLERDVDGNGRVDVADLRGLRREDAVEIFIEHYYQRPGIAGLPKPLQPSVFDMNVNAGRQSIRLLQRLLSAMGFACAIDGRLGPKTGEAAARALDAAPDHLVDAYGIERRNYYYRLADRRPPLRKFARRRDGGKGGWILRAEEFINQPYHLSAQDHARRVAAWA